MKTPFVTHEQLLEIVKKYPTPFHLYDEKGIRENARQMIKAFSFNPGFKEFFAVKATPNPIILKILKEEGCGVDCSSLTELMLAEALGFKGDEIMFSSNVTPAKDYAYAYKLGAIINLDDISHIDYLEQNAGIPELICLRYNPGGDFAVESRIMDTPADAKYGFTKQQMLDGVKILMKKGAKRFGIHAFLASNTLTNEYYPALAKLLFETANELKTQTGANIEFINLSGGVGIPYLPDEKPNDINLIAQKVQAHYEEAKKTALGDTALYTELGRYMLGPYGCLVSKVIHEKKIYKNYIGLDACAVNLMRPAIYKAYHHITVSGKQNAPHDHIYDVTGSLCENNDKFAIDRKLPKIDIGDYIIIHDTGAHGFAMGYNYNGKLRSAEVLLKENGETELIRRAETPKDYFATLDILGLELLK